MTTSPWGQLAVLDLHGCDAARLADPDAIRRCVAAVIDAIGMRAHGAHFGGTATASVLER